MHTIMHFVCYSCYLVIVVQAACLLPALVRKLVFGFYKRVKPSQNSIVQAIRASDIWWKYSIRAHWNKLLYVHNPGQGGLISRRFHQFACRRPEELEAPSWTLGPNCLCALM